MSDNDHEDNERESYADPFWSKLNKIFSLLIELFVLALYFILLYIYILLHFVVPFSRYLP